MNREERAGAGPFPAQAEVSLEQPQKTWPGWSSFNANQCVDEKDAMGLYFARHGFLVSLGGNPESSRLHAASILVAPGTTQNIAVQKCLDWVDQNWKSHGPFSVIWYTPGTLMATTLRDFREAHQHRRSAAELFLFPGQVEPDVESATGRVPVEFAQTQLRTHFTYSILSSYTFDLANGLAYFHYNSEVTLQRACAELKAGHKFLFLAPNKFATTEGEQGYSVCDLFQSANIVTIYTVQSEHDELIKAQFQLLGEKILSTEPTQHPKKILNLCIVERTSQGAKTSTIEGYLRETASSHA